MNEGLTAKQGWALEQLAERWEQQARWSTSPKMASNFRRLAEELRTKADLPERSRFEEAS